MAKRFEKYSKDEKNKENNYLLFTVFSLPLLLFLQHWVLNNFKFFVVQYVSDTEQQYNSGI